MRTWSQCYDYMNNSPIIKFNKIIAYGLRLVHQSHIENIIHNDICVLHILYCQYQSCKARFIISFKRSTLKTNINCLNGYAFKN